MKRFCFVIAIFTFSFTDLSAECFLKGVQYLEAGKNPVQFTVNDLNNDGKQDVAVAGISPGIIRVFANQGDGSFAISDEKRMKSNPLKILSADFNSDQLADLAVSFKNGIVIFTNLGTGKFSAGGRIDIPSPVGIAAGDFNSDSKADLAAINSAGTLFVFLSSNGSFRKTQSFSVRSATDLTAVDLGSDQILDLIVSSAKGTITVFSGSRAGAFQTGPAFNAVPGASQIASGLIDGDRSVDLVVSGSNGDFAVLLNRNHSFQRRIYSSADGIKGLTLGDFNRDQKNDLVIVTNSSRASLFSGNGKGSFTFTKAFSFGLFSGPVDAADLDGDELNDLIAAEIGAAGIFKGNGKNSFSIGARTITSKGGNLFAGDFNADGNPDLVISGSSESLLLRGKGNGTFHPAVKRTLPQIGQATVADLNDDGRDDIAGFHGNFLKVWFSSGDAQFKETSSIRLRIDPHVQALDVNGDSHLDLAVMLPFNLNLFLNNGNGSFSALRGISVYPLHHGVLADLNRDGVNDLAAIHNNNQSISVLLGGPNFTFEKHSVVAVKGCPADLAAGDANGDGNIDIVVGSSCSSNLQLYLGDGAGNLAPAIRASSGSASFEPVFVDFNGDGKEEVLAIARDIGRPSITMAPDFNSYQLFGPFYWNRVATADFDRDGFLDLAASSFNSTAVFMNCK